MAMSEHDQGTDAQEPFDEPAGFVVDLGAFEGPIDLLLSLARDHKVDLGTLSILALADQYLAYIARARQLRIEIAADYLVMAAWLAYLKSRLLLPVPPEDPEAEPTAKELAEALAFQLRRLQAMQTGAVRLMARARLGQQVFPRGAPEAIRVTEKSLPTDTLFELLTAYSDQRQRNQERRLTIQPPNLYTLEEALRRLEGRLGLGGADWRTLASFLPEALPDDLSGRSAVAAMLLAGLELAKSGRVRLRQERTFGPIWLRPSTPDESHE